MYQRILILLSILVFTRCVHALHINCNEKGFLCKNSTHFSVCADIGGGFTITMDDVEQQCPENTYCDNENEYECMEITTTTTTTATPKNPEASVLTLQWPPSYLSNLGMDPATVQPNSTAPIIQRPPTYSPVVPSSVESFAILAAPSTAVPGTTIVKELYEDNYLKILPIIKSDTIDNLPRTVPLYEGANHSDFDDATTKTVQDSVASTTESNTSTPTLLSTTEPNLNSTTPDSIIITDASKINSTTPDSEFTNENLFNSTTEYPLGSTPLDSSSIVEHLFNPTTEYPISSTLLNSLSSVHDLYNSTTENPLDSLTLDSTTECPISSTLVDSLSKVQDLYNSTTEYPIDLSTLDSTTEYPISSTILDSKSSVQDLYTSTTENPTDSSTLDSTTEYSISSTILDSQSSVQDLYNSTTENPPDSSTLDSTTEYPISSTILESQSSVQDLYKYNSTTENPLNASTLDSTTEHLISSTIQNSLSSVRDLHNSITENPLDSSTLDSTTEYPTSSTLLDSLSPVQDLYNSTTENPPDSSTLDSTTEYPISSILLDPQSSVLYNSASENPPDSLILESKTETLLNSTSLDSISTTQNMLNSTTENPLTSETLNSTLLNSTTENQPKPTIWVLISNNKTTENTPDLVSSTEPSILNLIQSLDPLKPFPQPTKFNATIENTPEILNLTDVHHILEVTSTTPPPGFETTVKSFTVSSVPEERDYGNSVDNVLPLISKFVNFSSNNLPDVPLTPNHVISTRMIQTTEMLPFNNRVSGFVPGNVVNTGAYSPLTIPLQIPNDPNAYNTCQTPGQYSDENSCHSYYMCNNNVRYKLVCPYNMVYSPSLQKCTTAKDQCLNFNEFRCNQVGRFPDSRSCYSYYDCQPNGAGFTASRMHCPWYSSFQPNNGQCVTNSNTVGCQQVPQTCRYPQQVPMEYQGGQSTPFTFYPDNPVTYSLEYGYPPVSSNNVPANVPIAASTPYLRERVLPADRVAIYNRENALPVDPHNTYSDRDYIREKLPVGVNYPYFGDNVVPPVDRTPTYVRDGASGANTNGYTTIIGNAPYVQENVLPIGGTNTYYQNNVPADQTNTYYQNKVSGENPYTYNGNVNVAPIDSANNKHIPANVGSVNGPNPSYIRDNNAPNNYDSGFNYYPAGEVTNRLAGTSNNLGERTRWSQPDPNNEASGRWTPNYYGSWFN